MLLLVLLVLTFLGCHAWVSTTPLGSKNSVNSSGCWRKNVGNINNEILALNVLKLSREDIEYLIENRADDTTKDNFISQRSGYISDGYSRSLLSSKTRREMEKRRERDEDGYASMFKRKRAIWKKLLIAPLKVGKKVLFKQKSTVEPGTLILVRHGESEWNANKTFTGWADPDISAKGHREIQHAARLLVEGGYEIDVIFTSRLKRAIRSTWMILQELNEIYLPVFKSWRLNERMYGALTGLSKKETAETLGAELVQQWRGSLRSRPPPVHSNHVFWPGRDRRYADLSESQIPLTESLLDCMKRTSPLWEDKISHELRMGRNVMVVAHANTLRGLVKIIDDVGDDEIQDVAIPTGIPVIYKFDKNLTPIQPKNSKQTAIQVHMSGLFLEKPGVLKETLKREAEWLARVPGYNSTMARDSRPMTSLERSLNKLEAMRELGEWAGQFIDDSEEEDDGTDGKLTLIEHHEDETEEEQDQVWEKAIHEVEEGIPLDPDYTEFHDAAKLTIVNGANTTDVLHVNGDYVDLDINSNPSLITNSPYVKAFPPSTVVKGLGQLSSSSGTNPVLVIIRHGITEHNKLGLFTGWEDVHLATDGIEQAKSAGRLLKDHGFEFDVVYTSWLSRAIETAWYIMDELDALWLPIIKSWRLNERMYGELTGMSKRMVAQRHGEQQYKQWRRGYKSRPPMVSSFSPAYPGNDKRYRKYVRDVRISLRESLIRSVEKSEPTVHRKLPKSESLQDCMDRTIPYYIHQIVPEAIHQNKRVLISSSQNAIRGLLMHLCDIPAEHICELEIPPGLPLIYDLKTKCVKLLDDGSGLDPLEAHNFGKAANYLFRPCLTDDGDPAEECNIQYMDSLYKPENAMQQVTNGEKARTEEKEKSPIPV